MSADAKAWNDGTGWQAIHDGECYAPETHRGTNYDLVPVLRSVEECMAVRYHLRWEQRVNPQGQHWLAGFEV